MLAQVFPGPVEASLHRGDTGFERLGDFRMTTPFLHQSKQRAILGPQLGQRMPQGVEFLRIDRSWRFGYVFMLLAEREKNPAQLLPPQLVDARVAREPEKPGLELRRGLQAIEGTDHLDEHLLRQVLHIIAPARHGVNEARDPMLIADNELPLGDFITLLGPPNEVGQRSRRG